MLYHDSNTKRSLFIVFVYAPPIPRQKQVFWELLQEFISSLDFPFIIAGDLNEIQCEAEKLGGAKPNAQRFKRLSNFKEANNLKDLDTVGNEFTWRKETRSRKYSREIR